MVYFVIDIYSSIILALSIYFAEVISDRPTENLKWVKIIAARYTGNDKEEIYGKRNSTERELLLKIKPIRVIAQKDIAGW